MAIPRPSESHRPIIFWGAGGHAKVLYELMASVGYRLVCLVDDDPSVQSPFPGVPIYHGWEGFRQWQASQSQVTDEFLVSVGDHRHGIRLRIQERLESQGMEAPVAIHPTAFVAASAVLAGGAQVLAKAVVAVEARIGRACIINTHASVDHECILQDGVHVAAGAVLAGRVHVDTNTLIGAGSVVLPGRQIGRNCIIGAGSVVTKDIPDDVIAYGHPASVRCNSKDA